MAERYVEEGPMTIDAALERAGVTENNLVEVEMAGHDLLCYLRDGRCVTLTLQPELADWAAKNLFSGDSDAK